MRYKRFPALVLALFFLLSASGQPLKTGRQGRAIICLTCDDGLASHLSTVLPALDSAALKATFFLNSIQGSSEVIGEASLAVSVSPGHGLCGNKKIENRDKFPASSAFHTLL